MTKEATEEIVEWLESLGYDFDTSDPIWMETCPKDIKWLDIFKLMDGWNKACASTSISKVAASKPERKDVDPPFRMAQ